MKDTEHIRLFGMSLQQIEKELDIVEKQAAVDLQRRSSSDDKDDEFYPQFKETFRREAAAMSRHYEIFYCLERSIRDLISEKLLAEKGPNWWDTAVPDPVRAEVEKNIKRERESGVTARSLDKIDYATFGELGDVVRANWEIFIDTFNNEKAFNRVMHNLNLLRGPIAHCCPLAEDEVVRLRLTIGDWFRLMS
ncbi:MAG: Swt1 family HEPN domain-containing protein [Parvibaculum sp.]|nr:Swt1 family HEPN domain-containing protein [Parvibaculum sp.]